ncbi:MAG: DUF4890 domain-containing protein [Bacteroidales bacterium]|nr:DUF4890 domain-containing protein [Bacteroidales bacterium]
MRKVLFISAMAFMLSVGAIAQENGGTRRERPDEATMVKMRTERMVEQLGLDETQAGKLLELNQNYPRMMMGGPGGPGGPGRHGMGRPPKDGQSLDGDVSGDKAKKSKKAKADRKKDDGGIPNMTEEQMNQMKADREAYEAGLKEILTEEQFKTWQESRNRPPRGERRPSAS